MLGHKEVVDRTGTRAFVMAVQSPTVGGFAPYPGAPPGNVSSCSAIIQNQMCNIQTGLSCPKSLKIKIKKSL